MVKVTWIKSEFFVALEAQLSRATSYRVLTHITDMKSKPDKPLIVQLLTFPLDTISREFHRFGMKLGKIFQIFTGCVPRKVNRQACECSAYSEMQLRHGLPTYTAVRACKCERLGCLSRSVRCQPFFLGTSSPSREGEKGGKMLSLIYGKRLPHETLLTTKYVSKLKENCAKHFLASVI
jgi:hypothetical protein